MREQIYPFNPFSRFLFSFLFSFLFFSFFFRCHVNEKICLVNEGRLGIFREVPFSIVQNFFLGATKHLYNWLCPSVGWLVGRVTHSFDDPHVAPYWPTWPGWPGFSKAFKRDKDNHL